MREICLKNTKSGFWGKKTKWLFEIQLEKL